jgi:hypothetical protein
MPTEPTVATSRTAVRRLPVAATSLVASHVAGGATPVTAGRACAGQPWR